MERTTASATDRRTTLRVLALEPFYGGSHRQFLDQWAARSRHRFTILGLAPCHWKWRMRHAAPDLAHRLSGPVRRGERWDLVLCSDMLDVAAFRGLAPRPLRDLPTLLYFHENQLTYPVRRDEERDLHFALTNVVSALAADESWFNSEFHRRDLLDAIPRLLNRLPDRGLHHARETIEQRSRVEWPGVESPSPTAADEPAADGRSPGAHIVWAARWEHDKGPELLFEALEQLEADLPLRFSIAGQRFGETPEVFSRARGILGARLSHLGPLPRGAYHRLLHEADFFLSTAHHEFFGIAAVEATLAGARPLLPDRLAYPELLTAAGVPDDQRKDYLWSGGASELAARLRRIAEAGSDGAPPSLAGPFRVFAWANRGLALDDRLEVVAGAGPVH